MNISLSQAYNGVMEYVSIENDNYVAAFEKWGIDAEGFNVYGLDQRTIIENMCNVKYFVSRSGSEAIVPYGFEYIKSTDDGEWKLYRNNYALPVVYAYDKVYDADDYLKMTGLDKQQVMLKAAAAEKYSGSLPRLLEVENNLHYNDYEIIDADGKIFDEDVSKIDTKDMSAICFNARKDCENYLVLNTGGGVSLINTYSYGQYTKESIPSLDNVAVNLGTAHEDKEIKIGIEFYGEGSYERDDFKVMYYDFTNYGKHIDELSKDTKDKFKVTTNRVSGKVDLDNAKMLCLSFPYSAGWHAEIDGRKTDTYCVNDLFVGIEVPEGEHDIEFYYITPGIRVGAVISIFSIAIIIVFWGFMGIGALLHR